ncbi:MAG TPA: hypothetical protein VFK89_01645 [Actinomycetota bacterium]|nr:hypothetical protein [Actinomycetota bacterium]
MKPAARALTYSVVGFAAEVVVSAVHDIWRKKPVRFRTSSLMLPVYALLLPGYEPLHDALRDRNPVVRASAYGVGILAAEYASGLVFRKVRGEAPWDYSDARFNVDGLIRFDYFFQWAALGMALEPLHDRLTRAEGPPKRAPVAL